jgi:hypothetical protein
MSTISSSSRKTSITSYLYSSIYKNRRRQSSLHNPQQQYSHNINHHYPYNLNKKLSLTRSIVDSNQISLLMNTINNNNNNNQNGKEQINNIDSESRDFVTVGSNEDIFIPTLNNTKRVQQPFQVLSEEDDENIVH